MKTPTVIFAAIAAMSLSACGQMNKEEHTFVVDSKDRECSSNGESTSCYFVVYGTEGEVFTNRDDLINGKFDSATLQAKFKIGATYSVKTTGWRVPVMSMKPNIYEATLVKEAE